MPGRRRRTGKRRTEWLSKRRSQLNWRLSQKRKLRWCAITRRDFATSLPSTLRRLTWGGSHPQAEVMQHSPFASPLLPTGKGFFNLARGGRPRSTTRAQEAASVIDETLNFFVKATGKGEASMRQQLTSQKREELRGSRDHWKARAEDEERFQKMKEEAWRLFERRPGFKRKTREEFEEELTRKVRNTPGNNRGEREKRCKSGQTKCKGSSNLRSGGTKPGRERKNSQRQRTWGKIRGPRIPVAMPLLAPEK